MENYKVTLIDGTFNVAEAKDVLTNMFTMKINFHSQKNVSHVERFGKTDNAALEKVEFLKAELAKLEAIIAAATDTPTLANKASATPAEPPVSVSRTTNRLAGKGPGGRPRWRRKVDPHRTVAVPSTACLAAAATSRARASSSNPSPCPDSSLLRVSASKAAEASRT